jgi:hypothetical protein
MNARQPSLLDKRWNRHVEQWVSPPELFRPSGYGVDVIPERDARTLVCEHHYSGTFPAARLSVGLKHGNDLVGVAVFSVPMNQATIPAHAGVAPDEGAELGRFVCLPSVAFNGETWFLARAFQALRADKPQIRAVVSFADPVERSTAEGFLCKPAHAGTIYQASNAAFLGRARPHWLWLDRDGRVLSPRALSKIRQQERGHRYAEAQLLAAGADPRRSSEEPAQWLERILRPPLFRRMRHPGNFTYVFGLDRETRAQAMARSMPYPRIGPSRSPR